jgi:hypothetical protein
MNNKKYKNIFHTNGASQVGAVFGRKQSSNSTTGIDSRSKSLIFKLFLTGMWNAKKNVQFLSILLWFFVLSVI